MGGDMIDLSTMTNFEIAGLIGGILSLIGGLIYIPPIFGREVLFFWRKSGKKPTKPIPLTWITWAIVGAMTVATYYGSGARATVLIAIGLCLEYVIVAIFSIIAARKREREAGTKNSFLVFTIHEKVSAVGVVVSAGLWLICGWPVVALMLMILTDAFGAVLTMISTYEDPHAEPASAWAFSFIGNLFGLLAVELWAVSWDSFAIYSLVVYWTIANGIILTLALRPTLQAIFATPAKSPAK